MVSSCQSGPVASQQAQARHAPTPWRPLAAVESWLETTPKWPKWHGFAASSRACHGAMARSLGLRGTAWQRTGLMSAMTSAVRRAWGASMRISMLPRPSRCSGMRDLTRSSWQGVWRLQIASWRCTDGLIVSIRSRSQSTSPSTPCADAMATVGDRWKLA